MPSEDDVPSDALIAAGQRRDQLKEAVSNTERAAASPAGDPASRAKLIAALEDLREAWDEHADEVESEAGLLTELTEVAPRLVNKITQLRDEHPTTRLDIATALLHATECSVIDEVRDEVLDVLVTIARHRQKGADLVYEGYSIDIGGD